MKTQKARLPSSRDMAPRTRADQLLEAVIEEGDAVRMSLPLTANENVMSRTAAAFMDSALESRYHLGNDLRDPPGVVAAKGGLIYRGLQSVAVLEREARDAACRRLGAVTIDFRPLSGVHAMTATLLAMTSPGDIVYSLPPAAGGHFATGPILRRAGRIARALPWDEHEFDIDAAALHRETRREGRPRLIFLDQGICLFPLCLQRLRAAVGSAARIVYDASHTLGLIYGGAYQAPLAEGCDILQGNTHKTFPGPQKALVAFRDAGLGGKFTDAMGEGLVSSVHTHHLIALCVTALEMDAYGLMYAAQVIRNAHALGEALAQQGFRLVQRRGRFTESHTVIVAGCGRFGPRRAAAQLLAASINVNARPFLGSEVLRLGVQELTRHGMRETQMVEIARLFTQLLRRGAPVEKVAAAARSLAQAFPHVKFSFDV